MASVGRVAWGSLTLLPIIPGYVQVRSNPSIRAPVSS